MNRAPFLFVPIAVITLLAACSGSVTSKPIPVATGVAATGSYTFEEVCYDGIVYVINQRGGMAPKLRGGGAYGIDPIVVHCPKD
jgi:hypothetical protein